MLVYLSGSMDGVTFEEGNSWRVKATKILSKSGMNTYNPYSNKDANHIYEPNEVFCRDIYYLNKSDIVLANLDLPSQIENSKIPFFTIGEMFLAHRMQKPIIAYTNCLGDRHGYKAIVSKSFTNLNDSLKYIKQFY